MSAVQTVDTLAPEQTSSNTPWSNVFLILSCQFFLCLSLNQRPNLHFLRCRSISIFSSDKTAAHSFRLLTPRDFDLQSPPLDQTLTFSETFSHVCGQSTELTYCCLRRFAVSPFGMLCERLVYQKEFAGEMLWRTKQLWCLFRWSYLGMANDLMKRLFG